MSYLSPLPFYPVPRDRLRRSNSVVDIRRNQKFEDAIESIKEECHIPRRHLLHPLYSNPGKPSFGVHPQTLQHAAASLRKTEHGQQILSCREPEQLCERQTEFSPSGNWKNFTENDQLRQSSSGKSFLATGSCYNNPSSIPFNNRNSNLLGNLNTATSKYEEKFLQKPKTHDFLSSFNDEFLSNPKSYSNLHNSQQYISNNISPTYPTPSNQTLNSIPIHIKNTSIITNPHNNSQTIKTTYSYSNYDSNNEQTSKTNNYPFQQSSNSFTNSSFNHQQPNTTFVDNNYIRDPKALIHEFATKTYVSEISNSNDSGDFSVTLPRINRNKREKSFVEELRDSSLTDSQRYQNQFQKSILQDNPLPKSFNNFYQTNLSNKGTDEVNNLIRDMQIKLSSPIDLNITPEYNKNSTNYIKTESSSNYTTSQYSTMSSNKIGNDNFIVEQNKIERTSYICYKCNQVIQLDRPGVTALGNFYHVECFVCEGCGKQLAGSSFYNVQGKCFCEVDYVNSLEKCLKCHLPIKQKILRALGGAYHPECFVCHHCSKSLDGIGFTTNKENEPHCMHCFHEKYSPRCATCLKPIAPAHNETEVPRIIAMDKSYHVECYRCEDCGLQLNSKIEGQGCYPIESRLFCKACNQKRLS
uniref:LIM zinc-binding domain-containing protein n=1 Tax=Strongyloides papillosus TaxID=174720 RepID=A0A0N5BC43_STREA